MESQKSKTISDFLTPRIAKRVAGNIVVLVNNISDFGKLRAEAVKKEGQELEDAGREIFNQFINLAFEKEYNLAMTIIADLFGISPDEAEDRPIGDIYDAVMTDRLVWNFLPQRLKSALLIHSSMSQNQAESLSQHTLSTSEAKQDTKATTSNLKSKK